MADIVDFPRNQNHQARELHNWVTDVIRQHPDKGVANRWAEMAKDTCQRFPGAPWPTQESVSLEALARLDASTQEEVLNAVQAFMQSYFNDVNNQTLAMHREILTLQKQVAESAEHYVAER